MRANEKEVRLQADDLVFPCHTAKATTKENPLPKRKTLDSSHSRNSTPCNSIPALRLKRIYKNESGALHNQWPRRIPPAAMARAPALSSWGPRCQLGGDRANVVRKLGGRKRMILSVTLRAVICSNPSKESVSHPCLGVSPELHRCLRASLPARLYAAQASSSGLARFHVNGAHEAQHFVGRLRLLQQGIHPASTQYIYIYIRNCKIIPHLADILWCCQQARSCRTVILYNKARAHHRTLSAPGQSEARQALTQPWSQKAHRQLCKSIPASTNASPSFLPLGGSHLI